jgi:hypothetical protein
MRQRQADRGYIERVVDNRQRLQLDRLSADLALPFLGMTSPRLIDRSKVRAVAERRRQALLKKQTQQYLVNKILSLPGEG